MSPSQPRQPEIRVTAKEAEATPARGRDAYSLDTLVPYHRGVYFAAVALKERLAAQPRENQAAIRERGRYQQMVQRYSDALRETIIEAVRIEAERRA